MQKSHKYESVKDFCIKECERILMRKKEKNKGKSGALLIKYLEQ